MSRARNIKPGFFKNEVLVELPFEQRLLFIGLWTLADRSGRLEDRPTRIKMEVFPADNMDVNAGLQALHDHGFLLRYSVDGCKYIQILTWGKHQNPHVKEAPSTIPAPCENSASTVQDTTKAVASPADSLIPDSLIPDSKASPHAPSSPELPAGEPKATDAGRACLLMRQAGCARVNSSHPNLLAALDEGVSAEALRDTYLENPTATNPFAWAIATARSRHAEGARPTPQARAGPVAREAPMSRQLQAIHALNETTDHATRSNAARLADARASGRTAEIGLPESRQPAIG